MSKSSPNPILAYSDMIDAHSDQPYSMSFTTATLLRKEIPLVLQRYAETPDWRRVRTTILAENAFQVRTGNASQRLFREAKSRIDRLNECERALLLHGSPSDQRQLLWLAMCRRYPFIGEFAAQVVRAKFLRLDLKLSEADYASFFSDRAAWHPEILQLTDQTREKQKSIVFKSLREAEIVDEDNRIHPTSLTAEMVACLRAGDPSSFHYYTATDQEIAAWMRG